VHFNNPHLQHNQHLTAQQHQQLLQHQQAMMDLQRQSNQQSQLNPQQMLFMLKQQIAQLEQNIMQQNMQQYSPSNFNNPSRFGNTTPQSAMINQHTRISTMEQNSNLASTSRFSSEQPPKVEEPEIASTTATEFTVTPTNFKFSDNTKISLNTITNKFNPATMVVDTQAKAFSEYFTVVEQLIKTLIAEGESKTSVLFTSAILSDEFYKTDITDNIISMLSKTSSGVYKGIKSAKKACADKYSFEVYNYLDKILTTYVNTFLSINSDSGVNIDMFSEDFNSLLTYLDENEMDTTSKALNDKLDEYIGAVAKSINLLEVKDNITAISVPYSVVYVDKHSVELGLYYIEDSLVRLTKTPPNEFLNSLSEYCINTILKQAEDNIPEFYLITMDKKQFYFTMDINGNFCVKLINCCL